MSKIDLKTINGISNFEYNDRTGRFDNLVLKRKLTQGLKGVGIGALALVSVLAIAANIKNHYESNLGNGFIYDSDFYAQDISTGNASIEMQLENQTNREVDDRIGRALEPLSIYEEAVEDYNFINNLPDATKEEKAKALANVVANSRSVFPQVYENVMLIQIIDALNLSNEARINIESNYSNADGAVYRIIVTDGDKAYEVSVPNSYFNILNTDNKMNFYKGDGTNYEAWESDINSFIKIGNDQVGNICSVALTNPKFDYKEIEVRHL